MISFCSHMNVRCQTEQIVVLLLFASTFVKGIRHRDNWLIGILQLMARYASYSSLQIRILLCEEKYYKSCSDRFAKTWRVDGTVKFNSYQDLFIIYLKKHLKLSIKVVLNGREGNPVIAHRTFDYKPYDCRQSCRLARQITIGFISSDKSSLTRSFAIVAS